jgi:hypothetical protein
MNHHDDGRVDARSRSTRDARRVSAAVDVSRDLGTLGLSSAEAGNLTAYLRGIRPVERGWTVAEIERLLFLRYLVERARIGS